MGRIQKQTAMANPHVTYRFAGVVLGCILLAVILPIMASTDEPVHLVETAPATIDFTPAGTSKHSDVPIGAQVQNAGTIELGLFAALRLDKYSAVTIADVVFNHKTRTIKNAKILVKTGRVWLANHVAGSRISLADERVVVKSEGGSLLFDKTPPSAAGEAFTRISAVTNPATIAFIVPGEAKIFYETALPPNKSVVLSPELVTSLLNASDRVTRASVWQSKLEPADKSIDTFYTDNKTLDAFTISRLVDDLQTTLAAHKPSLFTSVREQLTFLPAAKARYWRDHAGSTLLTALENPGSIDWQRIAKSVLPYPSAREVFATLVPYTRLIASSALPQKTKVSLEVLASLDGALSSAGGVDPIPVSSAALREIAFTNSATEKEAAFRAQHLKNFVALARDLPADAIELCAAGIAAELSRSGAATTAAAYKLLITKDATTLTNLLTSSIALADTLASATHAESATIIVEKTKADLAAATHTLPSTEPLKNLAQRISEVEHKITYLGTLHGSATFDSDAYSKWSLEHAGDETIAITDASIATATTPVTESATPATPTPTEIPAPAPATTAAPIAPPVLVERPQPVLQQVFDLLKADAVNAAK